MDEATSSENVLNVPATESVESVSSTNTSQINTSLNVQLFNQGIAGIQVSPISANRLKQVSYPTKKYREVVEGLKKTYSELTPVRMR